MTDTKRERATFHADAEPMGFDLLRQFTSAPEPWSEYLYIETGHRWAGWLARAERAQATDTALENCRLYAARHRKEPWAQEILRFCADGGAAGSPLRAQAQSGGDVVVNLV